MSASQHFSVSAMSAFQPIASFQHFRISAFQYFPHMSRLPEELRQRTKRYAAAVVRFYVALPHQRREVETLGHQLLRSGTSVAAHAREAGRARSAMEFCSKVDALLQEADESSLWLELLREECGLQSEQTKHLHRETNELMAIFVTMVSRTKQNSKFKS
jgi:four helix bundle protein